MVDVPDAGQASEVTGWTEDEVSVEIGLEQSRRFADARELFLHVAQFLVW